MFLGAGPSGPFPFDNPAPNCADSPSPHRINLPTGGAALLVLFLSLKLNPHQPVSLASFISTFDFLGLFLVVGGLVLLLVGFSFGEHDWSAPATIALLVVGVVVLLLAALQEATTKRSPVIPPRLFKTRTTAIILVVVFFQAFGFIACSYYGPIYFRECLLPLASKESRADDSICICRNPRLVSNNFWSSTNPLLLWYLPRLHRHGILHRQSQANEGGSHRFVRTLDAGLRAACHSR